MKKEYTQPLADIDMPASAQQLQTFDWLLIQYKYCIVGNFRVTKHSRFGGNFTFAEETFAKARYSVARVKP